MKIKRFVSTMQGVSAIGLLLGLPLGTHAATITQTNSNSTANGGESWLTEADWDGPVNTPGNDYINNTSNWDTRTPPASAGADQIFLGDSLTITNGARLKIKHAGVCTISNLTIAAGSQLINGGAAAGSSMAGSLALTGSGSVTFSTENNATRVQDIDMLITAAPTIDNIYLINSSASATGPGWTLNNTNNTFSGTWNVQGGYLKGAGLGAGSFIVENGAYLDIDSDYTNDTATLTINSGGQMLLDQNITLYEATINYEKLQAKTWTGAELKAHPTFGSAFDAASLDTSTITILSGPPAEPTQTVHQDTDMLLGADWTEASYWDNNTTPTNAYLYANSTADQVTQTPVDAATFEGYSLDILNGAVLNLQGAANYQIDKLTLGAGSKITRSSTGTASMGGKLTYEGTGELTFSALTTNSMTTINSLVVASNASISKVIIDMEDPSVSNTFAAAQSGFIFASDSDFDGLWQVEAGMLKGSGFGSGSFLVTEMGRLDFDATYYNLDATLTIEGSSTSNTATAGNMILDQTVTVGSATVWGETLAPGMYTGAELKAHPIYGGAWAGDKTSDTAILAVGVSPPVYQIKGHSSGSTWTDTTSWENGLAPSSAFDYVNSKAGQSTRNPSGANTFPGKSLTIGSGAQLKLQFNAITTITNLTMEAGSELRTVNNTTLNGDMALTGSGALICDFENDTREMIVNSLVTAEDTITNIIIRASQGDIVGNTSGFNFANSNNTFTGTWIIEEGFLKGAGVGQSSFVVEESGYLDIAGDYYNTNATLTVEQSPTNSALGGMIMLDDNMTVSIATLFGVTLPGGTYTGADLKANATYGAAFDALSSDTATLTVIPPKVDYIGPVEFMMDGSDAIIGWEGSQWGTYTLQAKDNLQFGSWTNVIENIQGITGPMIITNATSGSVEFFRIIVE